MSELTYCPECDGLGTIDGFECGVCCGDRLIWPADIEKPHWLTGRFMDHSHYDHRCDNCERRPGVRSGAQRIFAERLRQSAIGYTPDHDAEHAEGDLVEAAVCYALAYRSDDPPFAGDPHGIRWPWEPESWKPADDPVRNLEKAGALIAAEIDRLQARAEVPA